MTTGRHAPCACQRRHLPTGTSSRTPTVVRSKATVAALDRGELRVAAPPSVEGAAWTTHTRGSREAILLFLRASSADGDHKKIRTLRDSTTRSRSESELRSRRRGRSRRGPAGVARYGIVPRARRHSHAGLREHRRPRWRRHDGRHLGHRRLVRADWQRLPSRGQGRHRRRARAGERAARSSGRRRRLPSAPVSSSSKGCTSDARP